MTSTIAVLVDADNAALGDLDQVLSTLSKHGEITIRRAYGNWFKPALSSWDSELSRRGFRAVQQSDPVKGKNATDLGLAVDAVDLHHTVRPTLFALVSSDSDYASLALFLRERGATVFGFGRTNTPRSFRSACTRFFAIDSAGPATPKPVPKRTPAAADPLADAVAQNADSHGWSRLNAIGQHMSQRHGVSAKDHGQPTWTKVFEELPGYELRAKGSTGVAVRRKPA